MKQIRYQAESKGMDCEFRVAKFITLKKLNKKSGRNFILFLKYYWQGPADRLQSAWVLIAVNNIE